jgi:hypothetical protein
MRISNVFLPKRLRAAAAGFAPLLLAVVLLGGASAVLAAPISGTVTNQTTKKPAAGDTVALVRLGMNVVAQTKTDARGHFSLDASDNDPMHLLRVTHDKATYFKSVPAGTQTVDVDVYDAAAKVQGVSTEADVARIEASPNGLSVIENYFVKNASSPPRTQYGPRAYEFYLPKNAQIVSAAAQGPGSMPLQTPPTPLGPPGDYSFVFPLRPGETRFQVSYQLPYSGSFQFQPRVAAPVDNLAIILPKSMQFTATPASAFQPIDEDVKVQTYLARNVAPQTKLSFAVSGTGLLPEENAGGQEGANNGQSSAGQPSGAMGPEAGAQGAADNSSRPGIGLGAPIGTPDPLHKYQWWIVSLVVILLAVGAGISMKRTGSTTAPATGPASKVTSATAAAAQSGGVSSAQSGSSAVRTSIMEQPQSNLLEALKEELFALETERLEGRIASEEYDRQKAAIEIVLKRALLRSRTKGPMESA